VLRPPTQEAPTYSPAFRIVNATMWPRPISCAFFFGTCSFPGRSASSSCRECPSVLFVGRALHPGKSALRHEGLNFLSSICLTRQYNIGEAAGSDSTSSPIEDVCVPSLCSSARVSEFARRTPACVRKGSRRQSLRPRQLRQYFFLSSALRVPK